MHLTGLLGREISTPCVASRVGNKHGVPLVLLQQPLHRQCATLLCAKDTARSSLLCRANGNTLQATADPAKRSFDLEHQAEGEYCMPGEVTFDNEAHKQFTVIQVEVKDYPGLLRVIAWVLNGLQLVVQNAR